MSRRLLIPAIFVGVLFLVGIGAILLGQQQTEPDQVAVVSPAPTPLAEVPTPAFTRTPPVILSPTPIPQNLVVQAYFSDPERMGTDCSRVFPVQREISQTRQVARAALEELLEGPTATEEAKGFITSIPEGVTIQRLAIEDGVASVDFNAALDQNVGGSCRVTTIRAQITQTLMQFDTVDEVIISINGETETILQP